MKSSKQKKGFTLVEILTVVVLATVIIMAAYSVYLMSYESYKKQSASAELTQNARIALERMSRDIRQTNEVVTTLPELGTNPGSSELKFQDGHTTTTQIQYLTYYLSGADLKRKVSHYYFPAYPDDWVTWSTKDGEGNFPLEQVDLDQVKAQNISSLQMWNNDVITLAITVSDGTSAYQFETKVLGRNIQ